MAPPRAQHREDRPTRLGVFGGTFDPPHNGHVSVARQLLESGDLDEILWIPASTPPHKPADGPSPAEIRLEMARAATAESPGQSVSDLELQREGPSYTVDTLRALRSVRPDAELVLIVGSDQFAVLDSWHDAPDLVRLAEVCVLERDESDARPRVPPLQMEWSRAAVHWKILETTLIMTKISSICLVTKLRKSWLIK